MRMAEVSPPDMSFVRTSTRAELRTGTLMHMSIVTTGIITITVLAITNEMLETGRLVPIRSR